MTMLEAKHVQLHGNMTVAGMNTREISPLRDGCELHLHQETGSVYVQRDGMTTMLSPMIVAAVELKHPLFLPRDEVAHVAPHPMVAQAEADERANAEARKVDADKVEKGARNLADEVLAELRDDTKSPRKSPRSTTKRS